MKNLDNLLLELTEQENLYFETLEDFQNYIENIEKEYENDTTL